MSGSPFDVFPAIDLREGRVVRLERGDFDRETAYADDPAAQARAFVAEGTRWLHLVDLDAARTGESTVNRRAIESVCASVREAGVSVQCGGGVRSEVAADSLFGLGVDRVVVGTAAIEDPALIGRLLGRWPGRIAVGVDVRDGKVATRGWTTDSGRPAIDVIGQLPAGVAAVVVTQIAVDGTLAGPDVAGLTDVLSTTRFPVIASGGVGSLDDLRRLVDLDVDGRRLTGAIVGKAIYERRFTLRQAMEAATPAAAE